MVNPVDPALLRPVPAARPTSAAEGAEASGRGSDGAAGAPAPSGGDVVAPSLLDQINATASGFDPFQVAERAGRALARSGFSIGNARPDSVASLQR